MLLQKHKTALKGFASVILILIAAPTTGFVVRGEWSPWVWEELKNQLVSPTLVNQIFTDVFYAAFYLMGFFLPYWVITFVLFLRRARSATSEDVDSITTDDRAGRLFLSLSMLILYLLLLKSILAFIRALPTDEWNGWLLILGIAMSAILGVVAYQAFKKPQKNT